MKGGGERLNGLSVIITLVQYRNIGLDKCRFCFELFLQEVLTDLQIAVKKPVEQSGHKLISSLLGSLVIKPLL